jgi:hypothetical protein
MVKRAWSPCSSHRWIFSRACRKGGWEREGIELTNRSHPAVTPSQARVRQYKSIADTWAPKHNDLMDRVAHDENPTGGPVIQWEFTWRRVRWLASGAQASAPFFSWATLRTGDGPKWGGRPMKYFILFFPFPFLIPFSFSLLSKFKLLFNFKFKPCDNFFLSLKCTVW